MPQTQDFLGFPGIENQNLNPESRDGKFDPEIQTLVGPHTEYFPRILDFAQLPETNSL